MLEYNLDISPASVWILANVAHPLALPFQVSEVGTFFAGPHYFTERSEKEGCYLVYTHKGCGCMLREGLEAEIPPGHAVLVTCAPRHRYQTLGPRWDNTWMHFSGPGVGAYADLLAWRAIAVDDPEEFARQFRRLEQYATHIDEANAARISHRVSALLTGLLLATYQKDVKKNQSYHPAVEVGIQYMQKNYAEPVAVEQLARAGNLSKFHFVRLFRQQTGTTPYQYLTYYRINQAKHLLRTTQLPVGEIAARVGYAGESNFIHQFRSNEGETPAQYRKTNIRYLNFEVFGQN